MDKSKISPACQRGNTGHLSCPYGRTQCECHCHLPCYVCGGDIGINWEPLGDYLEDVICGNCSKEVDKWLESENLQ